MAAAKRSPSGDSPVIDDADWEPLSRLCRAVAEDLPDLAATITARIRAEHPIYEPLPRNEHLGFIEEQTKQLLAGLAGRRLPTPEQAATARKLGSRRARQGLPVEILLDGFHIGYREVWNTLLNKANTLDPESVPRLIDLVNLMWSWLRLTSGASADAHSETLRSQQAVQINLTHRFLRILRGGETHSDEAAHLARALSFDPDGIFQAFCVPATSSPEEDVGRLQQRLAVHRGTVQIANQGTVTVIVCQDMPSDAIIDTVHQHRPQLPIGVGLSRRGLAGAAASIVDAERTLAVAAHGGGAADFRHEWLFATLLTHRHQLAPLLQAGQGGDAPPAHLVAAVRAYAENGFSVAAAARALHVHPNTVTYRLERWHQLTGWTPRTLDGLMKSLLSLRLFPPPAEDSDSGH
jgi:PucR C-terminal helix-turn-helix domain/GGDEF-like domain